LEVFSISSLPSTYLAERMHQSSLLVLGQTRRKPKKSVHQTQQLCWRKISNKTLTLSNDFMYEIHNKPTTTTQVAGDHGRHQSIKNQLDGVQNSSEKISVSLGCRRGKVTDLEQLGVAAK
jgi:hypothetical protein